MNIRIFTGFLLGIFFLGIAASPKCILAQVDGLVVSKEADSGVAQILLHNRISSEAILGKQIPWQKASKGRLVVRCFNADKSEILELFHHDDSVTNTVQEIRIVRAEDIPEGERGEAQVQCQLKEVEHFATLRNVKLGISINEVTAMFGSLYRGGVRKSDTVVKYTIESNLSHFLRHYNEQFYYGNYYFRGGRLIEAEFGFAVR